MTTSRLYQIAWGLFAATAALELGAIWLWSDKLALSGIVTFACCYAVWGAAFISRA